MSMQVNSESGRVKRPAFVRHGKSKSLNVPFLHDFLEDFMCSNESTTDGRILKEISSNSSDRALISDQTLSSCWSTPSDNQQDYDIIDYYNAEEEDAVQQDLESFDNEKVHDTYPELSKKRNSLNEHILQNSSSKEKSKSYLKKCLSIAKCSRLSVPQFKISSSKSIDQSSNYDQSEDTLNQISSKNKNAMSTNLLKFIPPATPMSPFLEDFTSNPFNFTESVKVSSQSEINRNSKFSRLPSHWLLLNDVDFYSKISKNQQHLKGEYQCMKFWFMIRELIQTEISYEHHLTNLWNTTKKFSRSSQPNLRSMYSNGLKVKGQDNILSLISVSRRLSQRLKSDISIYGVSTAFISLHDELRRAYSSFAMSIDFQNVYRSPSRTSKQSSNSIGTCNLDVQDIIIMPIQRIMRYVQILQELVFLLPKEDLAGRLFLDQALSSVRSIAQTCDSSTNRTKPYQPGLVKANSA